MSAADRLLDAAVAPFNAELSLAARQQLAAVISEAGDSSNADLDAAAQRLESHGTADPGKRWRVALYILLAIVSVLAWADSRRLVSVLIRSQSLDYSTPTAFWTNDDLLYEDFRTSSLLTSQQKLLLMLEDRSGSTLGRTWRDAAEPLLNSDPKNPAYLAEYLRFGMGDPGGDSVLPTARELDPQNSYFTLLGASRSADDGLKKANSAALEEAISLFHQAAAQTDFDTYKGELMRQRMALFPKQRETLDLMLPTTCLPQFSSDELNPLIEALKQNASSLVDDGDAPRMAILIAAWQEVCEKILKSSDTDPTNIEYFTGMMRGPLNDFRMAADKLGLREESSRLQGIEARFEAWDRASFRDFEDFPRSEYADRALPFAKPSPRTPELHADDLRPGLAAEHAQLNRALALGGWLVLFPVTVCAGLFRFRAGALSRRTAPRLAALLRPVDFAWILGGGIVLPLVFYLIISWFTPFGLHSLPIRGEFSYSLRPTEGNTWAIADQALALVLLLIALPLLVTRWRLTRRAKAIGLTSRSHLLWLAVLAAFVAIPLLGVGDFSLYPYSDIGDRLRWSTEMSSAGIVYYVDTNWVSIAAVLLIGGLALTLLSLAIFAAASRQRKLLRRLVLAECLVPVYATAALVMAILALSFHAEEKYWVAHDTLLVIPPNAPFLTRFDQQAAQDVRQDLREIWGKPDE